MESNNSNTCFYSLLDKEFQKLIEYIQNKCDLF